MRHKIVSILLLTCSFLFGQQNKGEESKAINKNVNSRVVLGSDDDGHKVDSISSERNKQVEGKHQVSYFLGGGLSSFNYNPEVGSHKNGLGFTSGFDYSYYWHPRWALTLGFTFDSFNSSTDLSGVYTSTPAVDSQNDDFTLNTSFNGFVETQNSIILSFPLEIRYRCPINKRMGVFGGLGPKVSYSLTSYSKVTKGDYTTEGLWPQYGNLRVPGNGMPSRPDLGLTTYTPRDKVKTDIGVGFSIVSDVDIYYKLNNLFSLYGGPYFEYQLNKTKKTEEAPLVEYQVLSNDPSGQQAVSNYHSVTSTNSFSGAKKLALGFKVGLIFDFGVSHAIKKSKQDARLKLEAEEIAKIALLLLQAKQDSLAHALILAENRKKEVLDSISNARSLALAKEARRLAEEARIKDSLAVASANAKAQNASVVMQINTDKFSSDELDVLKLPIVFQKGSSDLTGQSKTNAQKVGEVLARHPDLLLRITGHTCDLGSDDLNYRLGLKRAQSLFKEYITAGVSEKNVTTLSKGESEPLVPNIDEPHRQKNRRVVCVIDEKK